jgi:hypothetical protein
MYTGRWDGYFMLDRKYMDDEEVWDVPMWSEDNPSIRVIPYPSRNPYGGVG